MFTELPQTSAVALDTDDNGQGGCFVPGPVGPPLGHRSVHMEVSVNGALLATADTGYDVISPCSTTTFVAGSPSSGCGSVSTDKSQYTSGETLNICYTVPGAYHVRITITKPDGTSAVVLDGDDDGSGGCFSPGIVGAPPGTRQVLMQVSYGGFVFATASTSYTVINDTTESLSVNPTSGAPGSTVTVYWSDDGDDNTTSASGQVYFDSQQIGSFQTEDGGWTGQVQIPTNAGSGDHTISVQDSDGSSQSVNFTVNSGCGGVSTFSCGGGGGATLTTDQNTYSVGQT